MNSAQMVLEMVLRRAMEAGREAAPDAERGDGFSRGLAFAYHDLADVLKEEAEIAGIRFSEAELREFDPDELLIAAVRKKAASA